MRLIRRLFSKYLGLSLTQNHLLPNIRSIYSEYIIKYGFGHNPVSINSRIRKG